MEMIPVSSANHAAAGYDLDQSILRIEFKNGNIYEYYDVPQYIFDEYLASDSKGKYAHQNIYPPNFTQQRIQ
ncbi:MAG: KTSC domain-containing protein [Candidatus Cloacimonadaceae bacterium]|jgi:hypothetical protein